MKKLVVILLSLSLLFSVTACDKKSPAKTSDTKTVKSDSQQDSKDNKLDKTVKKDKDEKNTKCSDDEIYASVVLSKIERLKNLKIKDYKGDAEITKLPAGCIFALSDDYGIGMDMIDEDHDGKIKAVNVVDLYDFNTGGKTTFVKCGKGCKTRSFVINDGRVYYIKIHSDRQKTGSGEWVLKEYDIKSQKTVDIDNGRIDDFSKYDYKDVSFADEESLFPRSIDVSNDKLVYNKVVDIDDKLQFQIVLYDTKTRKSQVIARGNDYLNDYLYEATMDGDKVIYTKYHGVNIDAKLRNTIYKFCDVCMYDLKTEKCEVLSSDDYITSLDISGNYITGVRTAEFKECESREKVEQLVIYDMTKKEWNAFIYDKVSLTNPIFYKKYIVWRDLAAGTDYNIYDFNSKNYVSLRNIKKLEKFEIVGTTDDSLIMLMPSADSIICKVKLTE